MESEAQRVRRLMETDYAVGSSGSVGTSIAISLKRIADCLEKQTANIWHPDMCGTHEWVVLPNNEIRCWKCRLRRE